VTTVKETFLSSIEQARAVFYRTVVAQAQRIEAAEDAFLFVFAPVHRLLKEQVEQNAAWLQSIAERVAGRRMAIRSQLLPNGGDAAPGRAAAANSEPACRAERDLRSVALNDANLQALLSRFPAEIRLVEEIAETKPKPKT
jgi:hypothetical protein